MLGRQAPIRRAIAGGYLREHPGKLAAMPPGACAVASSAQADDAPPPAVLCLRAESEAALATIEPGGMHAKRG